MLLDPLGEAELPTAAQPVALTAHADQLCVLTQPRAVGTFSEEQLNEFELRLTEQPARRGPKGASRTMMLLGVPAAVECATQLLQEHTPRALLMAHFIASTRISTLKAARQRAQRVGVAPIEDWATKLELQSLVQLRAHTALLLAQLHATSKAFALSAVSRLIYMRLCLSLGGLAAVAQASECVVGARDAHTGGSSTCRYDILSGACAV